MAAKEEKHEEGAAEGEEGGKSKKPLIIIIAVIVVLVIIGAVVAVMLLKSPEEAAPAAAAAGAEGATAAAGEHGKAEEGKGKKEEKKKGGKEEKPGPMLAIDNVVVNLVSETGSRYTKVSLAIEMDAPEAMLEATERKPVIQDIVIGVISQKTADELVTYKGKEGCKNDILDKVNKMLHDGSARNVYFTNFIVQ